MGCVFCSVVIFENRAVGGVAADLDRPAAPELDRVVTSESSFTLPSRSTGLLENLGHPAGFDFLIQPSFSYVEGKTGRFLLENSYLGMGWKIDDSISSYFRLGGRDLMGQPKIFWLSTEVSESQAEWNLVEGYLQWSNSLWGRIRVGLIPVPFGLQGGENEIYLYTPLSLFWRQPKVSRRDLGLNYHIDFDGFFSDWTVHHGEGGADVDNEAWFTARWGYGDRQWARMGFSASVGRLGSSYLQTEPQTFSHSVESGQVRMGQAFLFLRGLIFDTSHTIRAEWYQGEFRQAEQIIPFRSGYVDLEVGIARNSSVVARYDYLDPESLTNSVSRQEASFGLQIKNKNRTFLFSIVGTKKLESSDRPSVHQLSLYWRMTPAATEGLSPL